MLAAARGARMVAARGLEARGAAPLAQPQPAQQQQLRFMSRSMEETVTTGVRVRGTMDQAVARLTRMLRNEGLLYTHKSQNRHVKPALRRYIAKKEAKRRAEKMEINKLIREALRMKELGY